MNLGLNYAASFTGALAITGLVAASLETACDIATDTSELTNLLADWQQVHPNKARAVTHGLAEALPEGWRAIITLSTSRAFSNRPDSGAEGLSRRLRRKQYGSSFNPLLRCKGTCQ